MSYDLKRLVRTSRGVLGAILLKVGGLAAVALTTGTAVTATTDETTMQSRAFVAHELSDGTVIDFDVMCIVTAVNGADTVNIKVKIGSTVIRATGAVNPTVNDVLHVRGKLVIRTDGATGTMYAWGTQGFGVEGTVTAKPFKLAEAAVDTTGALTLAVTATWSSNNAGNSCRCDGFVVHVSGGEGADRGSIAAAAAGRTS